MLSNHEWRAHVRIFAISILLCLSVSAAAPQKILRLPYLASPVSIDGAIDPLWARADSVEDFVQYQPYNGKEPTRRTVAKVYTTDDALYCLMICFEDGTVVERHTGVLDDGGGDIVSIMLDTFGDKSTAYKFAVSASGVRADCRLLDDARNRDYNWDGIWFSSAKVYDWGFVIEIQIPYRAIQYDERLKEWGLDFDRWIPRNAEDIYWCPYAENEGQRISKFGKLVFDDFSPTAHGLNLEVYPVGIMKATYLHDEKYKVDADAGIDIFYNPSKKLTFQLTANPDFAQIEADPYEFNISRYETYYSERRPFFTQGNEVFMASGRQSNTGFYSPLELFYSRRIGKILPDGSEVPLILGSKAFGRVDDWEYGGFVAATGERSYQGTGGTLTEQHATFASARVKKQILGNSSIGVLFVGKHSQGNDNGVIDIDGAFRGSDWQLSYQFARSYNNGSGDFAGSFGTVIMSDGLFAGVRGKAIGEKFDIDQVGFVPWKGTADLVGIAGPRWYFTEGTIRQVLLYGGGALSYEKADLFTDHSAVIGYNMQFRSNWGFEIEAIYGRMRDAGTAYYQREIHGSTWISTSAKWNASAWGGYTRTYNFARGYDAFYGWYGMDGSWRALDILQIGSTLNVFIEGNPRNDIEEITWNARPFVSLTPFNDFKIYTYVDNLLTRSSGRLERVIAGLLFSYQFLPKSWVYLAINDARDRGDAFGTRQPVPLQVRDRAAVLKIKYLYYF